MSDEAVDTEKKALPRPPSRRVATPTLLQMEAVECGAAALGIILGYWGRTVPLEELRVECGVSRDGSKANNVLKAARKYGLQAKGFKYDDLSKLYDLQFPVILFWNMNHFLVLEGFKGGKPYLNDPAQGPRRITLEDLDSSYSGVVLTFEPGPDFEPGGHKPSMTRALRVRLSDSKLALIYVMLCGLFLVLPGLIVPTFSRIFIDDYLVGQREYMIKPLLWSMGLTAIVLVGLNWLQKYYLLRLETKLSLLHSSRFFAHIQRLPIPYFVQRYAGEIGSRVAINDRVADVIGSKLTTTAIDLCVVVFYFCLMLLYDVPLTFTVLGIAALNVAVIKLVARARTDASRRLLQDKGKLMGTAMGGLTMIETLKATGGEPEFFARWSGYQSKSLMGEQALSLLSETTSTVPVFVGSLATMVVYVMGGYKVMSGGMTVGMLVAYQTLVGSFTRPLSNLVNFGGTLQELEGDMNRLDDVIRYPQDQQYSRAAQATTRPDDDQSIKLSGRIELSDISFGYSPLEPPLIENFNLVIEPGQRVALVGGSGSGKSTIAKLVSGLYEPWKGQVLFDDVPRGDLPRSLVTNSLAVVDQEVFLFGGTVRENVSMWDATLPPPDRGRLPGRRPRGGDRGARGTLRVDHRGGRAQSERRPAPAARDRSRAGGRADHRRARRGDLGARPDDRDAHRRESPAARMHLHHHRPPAQHHQGRRQDRGDAARQGRPAGDARRHAGHRRSLPGPHRPGVSRDAPHPGGQAVGAQVAS